MKFLFLSLMLVSLTVFTAHAAATSEDQSDTIETQCQNGKLVSLVKFNSELLGQGTHIFYDCSSKGIYMNGAKEINAPLKFNFAVSDNDLELYFYLPATRGQSERSRKVEIVFSKNSTLTVNESGKVEKKSFERRNNASHSLQNFQFLTSLVNVPGWETIDNSIIIDN